MCNMHYLRAWKSGIVPVPRPSAEERFWAKVDRSGGEGSCWNWIAAINDTGYGAFGRTRNEGPIGAHRYSYELEYGPIPVGQSVLHSCDNRACVNPRHLRAGTQAENITDAVTRGRNAKGNQLPGAKLTPESVGAVRALLASGMKPTAIARVLGVNHHTVTDIRDGVTWKHV